MGVVIFLALLDTFFFMKKYKLYLNDSTHVSILRINLLRLGAVSGTQRCPEQSLA